MGRIVNGINKVYRKASNGTKSIVWNTIANFKKFIIGFKIMVIIIPAVIIAVFLAMAWDVVSNALSTNASTTVSDYVSTGTVSTSLEKDYESSGSLVMATDADTSSIKDSFLSSVEGGDLSYSYDYLKKTVSTLNTNNSGIYLETGKGTDPIDLGENYSLYEHIMNTERYNFNRITWGKYTRGVKQSGPPKLTVDAETRLQYPVDSEYDLERFVSMTRPYLQTWIIPMSMFSGVTSDTSNSSFANFAYQTISEGYHRITVDQHSLDTKTRVNNYLIYDKTTTDTYIERTCTTYEHTETVTCTDEDYKNNTNGCVKAVTTYIDTVRVPGVSGWEKIETTVQCTDADYKNKKHGCTRGTTTRKKGEKIEACVDKEVAGTPKVEKDIRENKSSVDTVKTEYNYILSSVEAFDYSLKNIYKFEAYYVDNNKYKEDLSKTDSHSSKEKEYKNIEETYNNFPENTKLAPAGQDLSKMKVVSRTVSKYKYKTEVKKEGLEYTDTLVWKDKLTYDQKNSTTQKGYTVEQLKKYLGNNVTLSAGEQSYYSELSSEKSLNLIDFMNAKKDIYTTYVTTASSTNIGYKRSYLATSYDILKKNLLDLYTNYNYTVAYGQSIVPQITEKKATNNYDYSWLAAGSFAWPTPQSNKINCLYGYTTIYGENHYGIDIAPADFNNPTETDIVAAKDGTVVTAVDGYADSSWVDGSYGNFVTIDHGDGVKIIYAHLTPGSLEVKPGDKVTVGQVIGRMGNSGSSTGFHLHYEISINGATVDPLLFYNVKSIKGYPEYETMSLEDNIRKSINVFQAYEFVSSK